MRRLFLAAMLAVATAGGAETGEHGESHGPSPLWKWANFAMLAGLLGYGIAKTSGKFFRGRTEEIQKAIREAQALRDQAEARAAEIDRKMAGLAAEIEALRSAASQEMAAEGERVKAETERLLARMQENAGQEIASAAKQAAKQLRAYSSELALELAEQKVRARITPDAEGLLVDAFVTMLRRPRGPVN